MMIADAQVHLWRNAGAPPHHRREPYLAEQLIEDMDSAGVARAVNCPAIWDRNSNDDADASASAHPERIATMGWFPLLTDPDAAVVETFLRKPGMLGLRFVLIRPEDIAAFRQRGLDLLWRIADDLRVPVALALPKNLLPVVGETARRFRGVRFLIDHMGVGPFEKLPAAMDHLDELLVLAKEPNVAIKATATPSMSNRDWPYGDVHPYLERAFRAFGSERLFWGTDYTRMPISLKACVEMFTDHLGWLKGADLDRVMGVALCEWIGWRR